jgi:signal transduction histidine kinase
LQEKFQDLGVTADTWKTHVERNDAWLVRLAERPGARPAVVVVRARRVFERVESDRSDLGGGGRFEIVAASQDGHALNDRLLPDVRVVFSESSAVASGNPGLPQLFTGLSLLFVVSLASLSGYLAWRGTRREIRISEMRAQFVASVSHELKTPLTSIRMFAELLEMRAADESTRTEYLNTIVNESERLTRLLNNVLDFSRIEHGQKNYSMEPTHLPEVVRSAMRVMEYPLMAQGFNVQVDMDETMPPIPVDQDAIKQAVLNLLTNAMKYSGKSRAIELGVSRDNGNAMIQVRDHGIGVPPHEQARIFEKFYRANVPENHTISGTGLGLALVAHVVDAHRGHIAVESRPGEGTTFSIRLPLSAGSSAQPAGPAAARHPATNEPSPGPATPAGAEVRS